MIHRKDGAKHKRPKDMTNAEFNEFLKSDDYILLCCACHASVHWCMRYLKMTWEEIKLRLHTQNS